VTSQNSSTIQEHLTKQGVRFGSNSALKFNQKPCINAHIFLDDIGIVFLPYLGTLRDLAVLAQEIAVLLMDGCSAHVSDDVISIPTEGRVRFITFAPHTTQVFQILDLTLFGIPKRCSRYELSFNDDNATSRKQWCRPMSGEHFVRLELSLTSGESRMSFYSTR
jgi:hypothetical protein